MITPSSLIETYTCHKITPYTRPIPEHHITLMNDFRPILLHHDQVIYDWGCGTGASTLNLKARYPNHLVIGVDRSIHRLHKNPWFSENQIHAQVAYADGIALLRGNIHDILRLHPQSVPIHKHYFLYPNPYPKYRQRNLRWYHHPITPLIHRRCGHIEVRSNEQAYVTHWAMLATQLNQSHHLCTIDPSSTLSLFEKKYLARGHTCYQLLINKI